MGLQRIGPGLTLVALAALSACGSENQAATQTGSADGTFTKGGDDRTGPYSVVEGWWKAAPDHGDEWSWGSVSGVAWSSGSWRRGRRGCCTRVGVATLKSTGM